MKNILEWLVIAKDPRQQAKVKRLMRDIIAVVFLAEPANAGEWIGIYLSAAVNEKQPREYLSLPHWIPPQENFGNGGMKPCQGIRVKRSEKYRPWTAKSGVATGVPGRKRATL
jgi:hypothetical protein